MSRLRVPGGRQPWFTVGSKDAVATVRIHRLESNNAVLLHRHSRRWPCATRANDWILRGSEWNYVHVPVTRRRIAGRLGVHTREEDELGMAPDLSRRLVPADPLDYYVVRVQRRRLRALPRDRAQSREAFQIQ